MGIPRFFGQWVIQTKYKNLLSEPKTVISLFIDMNGLIHAVAAETYNYGKIISKKREAEIKQLSDEVLLNQFYDNFFAKLTKLVKKFPQLQNLILAVDGVAPVAKIYQQRGRRYKKSQLAPSRFNSNAITPGTWFMDQLHTKIEEWIKQTPLPPNTIYSSHNESGEGEHKIFNFIRNGRVKQGEGGHVVYGLDADLIMLSLLSPLNQIYLQREETGKTINIDALKAGIIKQFNKNNPDIVIMDFVVMIYFIGNDFLPHLPAISSITQIMEVMFDLYRTVPYLTDGEGQIQWKYMSQFVDGLAAQEARLLRDRAAIPTKYPLPNLQLPLNQFRTYWYSKLHIDVNQSKFLPHPVVALCQQYIFGLEWVLAYYTGKSVTNWFVFNYHYGPLLVDLAAVLRYEVSRGRGTYMYEVLKTPHEPIILPIYQLLAVLPPTDSSLIPSPYGRLFSDELADLAPTKFNLDLEGAHEDWEAIALLPKFNLRRIISAVERLDNM